MLSFAFALCRLDCSQPVSSHPCTQGSLSILPMLIGEPEKAHPTPKYGQWQLLLAQHTINKMLGQRFPVRSTNKCQRLTQNFLGFSQGARTFQAQPLPWDTKKANQLAISVKYGLRASRILSCATTGVFIQTSGFFQIHISFRIQGSHLVNFH